MLLHWMLRTTTSKWRTSSRSSTGNIRWVHLLFLLVVQDLFRPRSWKQRDFAVTGMFPLLFSRFHGNPQPSPLHCLMYQRYEVYPHGPYFDIPVVLLSASSCSFMLENAHLLSFCVHSFILCNLSGASRGDQASVQKLRVSAFSTGDWERGYICLSNASFDSGRRI